MNEALITRLKQCLTLPLPGRIAQLKMAPSYRPDVERPANATKAGVLILLYPNPANLHIVFQKRTEYPGVHSAQISFPGGKFDSNDENLVETAIRETEEEIGISNESIEVIGRLTPLYIPVSEIEVYPTVAFMAKKQSFTIDPEEVDYLIEEPLNNLLKPGIIQTKQYTSRQYSGIVPYYDIQGNHVWGATAMILSEFIEVLVSAI